MKRLITIACILSIVAVLCSCTTSPLRTTIAMPGQSATTSSPTADISTTALISPLTPTTTAFPIVLPDNPTQGPEITAPTTVVDTGSPTVTVPPTITTVITTTATTTQVISTTVTQSTGLPGTPTTPSYGIAFIVAPTFVIPYQVMIITIAGKPSTLYTISVTNSGSPLIDGGLYAKLSDASGSVSWTWVMFDWYPQGLYLIQVTGGGETASHYFTYSK
jgi:hypothetical protein